VKVSLLLLLIGDLYRISPMSTRGDPSAAPIKLSEVLILSLFVFFEELFLKEDVNSSSSGLQLPESRGGIRQIIDNLEDAIEITATSWCFDLFLWISFCWCFH
jgi:hypothetical protein